MCILWLLVVFVVVCVLCEVCVFDPVSYVIIQAYVYLKDEIILLGAHKR